MLRVIIHVRREGDAVGHDLEVPAEVAAEQLAEMLTKALGLEHVQPGQLDSFALVTASGQLLRGHETLADVGVWDGATLFLRPTAGAPEKVQHPAVLVSKTQRRYPLTYSKMRIGRGSAKAADPGTLLDLVDLRDESEGKTVSRNHALALYMNGHWSLIAFSQAENGTYVNDTPITPDLAFHLQDGDRVEFGDVGLVFHLTQETV